MAERIYILGDSHAKPLANAIKQWPLFGPDGAARFRATFVDSGLLTASFVLPLLDGRVVLNPIVEKALDDYELYSRFRHCYFPDVADLVFLFGYADSHIFGINLEIEGYCFDSAALHERPAPSEPNYFIHSDILRELFRTRLATFFQGVELLRNSGLNVSVLAGPPPHRDNDYIQPIYSWPHVNAPSVRKAIFYAIDGAVRESASRLGIPYLDAVSAFCDEDGFLRKEYYGDGVHANSVYGRDVLSLLAREAGWERTELRYEPGSEIRFGADGNSNLYKLDGWSEPEDLGTWTDGYRAELRIPLKQPFTGSVRLTVEAGAYVKPAHPMLHVCIVFGHIILGEWSIKTTDVVQRTLIVPASVLAQKTVLNLAFHIVNPVSPAELGNSGDGRLLGLTVRKVRLDRE